MSRQLLYLLTGPCFSTAASIQLFIISSAVCMLSLIQMIIVISNIVSRCALLHNIGVGRFRILGGGGGGVGGGKVKNFGGDRGGTNSQQAHDVVTTSMRRNDVASTSFRRRVPIRFLINQCQIITFLILKYDIIENSRIELRGIVLPVQMGGLLVGPKGMLAPLSNYWGAPGPPPPSSYAYA